MNFHERFSNGVREILLDLGVSFSDPDVFVYCVWRLPVGDRVVTDFSDWIDIAPRIDDAWEELEGAMHSCFEWSEQSKNKGLNYKFGCLPYLSSRRHQLSHLWGWISPDEQIDTASIAPTVLREYPQLAASLPLLPKHHTHRLEDSSKESDVCRKVWAWLLNPIRDRVSKMKCVNITHFTAFLGHLVVFNIRKPPLDGTRPDILQRLGVFLRALDADLGSEMLSDLPEPDPFKRFLATVRAAAPGLAVYDNGSPAISLFNGKNEEVVKPLKNEEIVKSKGHRASVVSREDRGLPPEQITDPAEMRDWKCISLNDYRLLFYLCEYPTPAGEAAALVRHWDVCNGSVKYPRSSTIGSYEPTPWRDLHEIVSRSQGHVLIVGGSGTGKERIAKMLHQHLKSLGGEFVTHNCAVSSEKLFEATLFGHVDGAFTGVHGARLGLLLQAAGLTGKPPVRAATGENPTAHFRGYAELEEDRSNRRWISKNPMGTLFLDEIAHLTGEGQGALLRILDGYGFRPVGWDDPRPIWVPVRVVAATRDVTRLLDPEKFRQDLRTRLDTWVVRTVDVVSQDVPSAMVAAQIRLDQLQEGHDGKMLKFGAGAFDVLMHSVRSGRFDHSRGNMRGVRAAVERAWSSMKAYYREGDPPFITPEQMEWACSEEWLIEPKCQSEKEVSFSTEVEAVLSLVREIFGQDPIALAVERCAHSNPTTIRGLLDSLWPDLTLEPDQERHKLLLARLFVGEGGLTKDQVALAYGKANSKPGQLFKRLRLQTLVTGAVGRTRRKKK
jgi:hypothetical protein